MEANEEATRNRTLQSDVYGGLGIGQVAGQPGERAPTRRGERVVRGGPILGAKRKAGGANHGRPPEEARTSFEVFLAAIPRLNAAERTVGWVMRSEPEEPEVGYDQVSNYSLYNFYTQPDGTDK